MLHLHESVCNWPPGNETIYSKLDMYGYEQSTSEPWEKYVIAWYHRGKRMREYRVVRVRHCGTRVNGECEPSTILLFGCAHFLSVLFYVSALFIVFSLDKYNGFYIISGMGNNWIIDESIVCVYINFLIEYGLVFVNGRTII